MFFFFIGSVKSPVGKIILIMPNLSGLLPAFFHQEDRAWLSSRFNRADGDCWNWCDRAYFGDSLHQNIAHSNIPLKPNIAIEIANSPLFTIGNTCSNGYTTYCPWKMMSGRLLFFFRSVKIRGWAVKPREVWICHVHVSLKKNLHRSIINCITSAEERSTKKIQVGTLKSSQKIDMAKKLVSNLHVMQGGKQKFWSARHFGSKLRELFVFLFFGIFGGILKDFFRKKDYGTIFRGKKKLR